MRQTFLESSSLLNFCSNEPPTHLWRCRPDRSPPPQTCPPSRCPRHRPQIPKSLRTRAASARRPSTRAGQLSSVLTCHCDAEVPHGFFGSPENTNKHARVFVRDVPDLHDSAADLDAWRGQDAGPLLVPVHRHPRPGAQVAAQPQDVPRLQEKMLGGVVAQVFENICGSTAYRFLMRSLCFRLDPHTAPPPPATISSAPEHPPLHHLSHNEITMETTLLHPPVLPSTAWFCCRSAGYCGTGSYLANAASSAPTH